MFFTEGGNKIHFHINKKDKDMEIAVMEKVYTAEEYLFTERNTRREDAGKYQFYKNKRIFMAGATRKHDRIESNLHLALGIRIGDNENYELHTSNMRIQSFSKNKEYFYSDGLIVKGKPEFADHYLDILTNPTLIIEVLSKSTQRFDRNGKFESYRNLDSFEEYILVAQNEPCVEHFYKNNKGEWIEATKLKSLDDVLILKNLPFQVPLSKIYQRVNFEEVEE